MSTSPGSPSGKGAGPAGGLLFAAVLLLVAYLTVTAVAGILRLLLGAAFLAVLVILVARVLRRP